MATRHGTRLPRQDDAFVAIVGWPQETNERLVDAWRRAGIDAGLLSPPEAESLLRAGDTAIGRFDVLPTLDGVEPGLEVLDELALRRVRVLNGREALLNAHDKLRTARLLASAGLPQPRTAHVRTLHGAEDAELPVVLKPRFGSWGADVFRCRTRDELAQVFGVIEQRPWFVRYGVIVQELVPALGYDLRLVVAAGRVVGAVERVARAGEWRTNISLGGRRCRARAPTGEAVALAVQAAEVIGAELVGVDLIPVGSRYVVLELNGAVEFNRAYDLDGSALLAAATALELRGAEAVPCSTRSRAHIGASSRSRA